MESVHFYSQGARLSGHLYRSSVEGAAVVVVGAWLTVKEQMPSNYAPLLAAAGVTALVFDYHGFGESGGEPREVESATKKSEDIRNAAVFLAGRMAHPARVGVLAICGSAGYTAVASVEDPVIRSIVMVAPWLHDAGIVRAIYGGEDGVNTRLARAQAARERYVASGEVEYVKAASNTDPTAAMYWEGDFLDYYLNPQRAAIPQWGGRFATMAWTEWLRFDPIAVAPRIGVPVRIVTSEASATPQGAKAFAAGLAGPHDLVWTSGTQFDFYDRPSTVRFAADRAVEHFSRTL
jgi:hypothetical protein